LEYKAANRYVERLPDAMTRGQGTSELRREKKRSHQWRGVAKILAAPPGTGRSATGLFSAHQRGTAKPCVRGQGGDLAETNYLLAHISEDKGHKRNKGIGVFHEYAFLVCSCKKTFFFPSVPRSPNRRRLRSASMKSGPLRAPDPISPPERY